MSQFQVVPCPFCGAGYQLTTDYLAQYGGQKSQCHQCGNAFTIPRLGEVSIPVATAVAPPPFPVAAVQVIPYMGPNYQSTAAGVWREGNRIVAVNGAVLPPRCVKCNLPAEGTPLRRKLYWHHPGIYFTILAGILIYAIIALCVRKSGTVSVCLCQRHIIRRRLIILFAWLSIPAAIVFFVIAGNSRSDTVQAICIPLGIVTFLVGVIGGVIGARIVAPSRIDDRYLWLKGAGRDFLDTLSPAR